MVWGYVAGAVAGAALDYMGNRANQDRQNQATRELWRQAPSDQMEGFRRAGLNPMLAYGRIDFPGSSANYAPSNFGGAITQGMQAAASMQSSEASTISAASSARQVSINEQKMGPEIDKTKAETAKLVEDGKISKATAQQVTALVEAMAMSGGFKPELEDPSTSRPAALERFMKQTQSDRDVQAALADIAERKNMQQLQEWINAPAANILMQAAQLLLKGFLGIRGSVSTVNRNSTIQLAK